MPRYVLIVTTEPRQGREDEYNRWYNDVHLADVLKVPGFVSAERLVAHAEQDAGAGPRYRAVFHIDSADIDATMAGFHRMTPAMPSSPGLDPDSVSLQLFRSVASATTGTA